MHLTVNHLASCHRRQAERTLSDEARERSSIGEIKHQLTALQDNVASAQAKLQMTQSRVDQNMKRIDELRAEAVRACMCVCVCVYVGLGCVCVCMCARGLEGWRGACGHGHTPSTMHLQNMKRVDELRTEVASRQVSCGMQALVGGSMVAWAHNERDALSDWSKHTCGDSGRPRFGAAIHACLQL